jgi:hypothetical protein
MNGRNFILFIIFYKNIPITSFEYRISQNDRSAAKCAKKCKPMSLAKKHVGMIEHSPKECYENCLKQICMTDQEREHRLSTSNFIQYL